MKKNEKALILFADLFTIGGLQQYNRDLCDALESEFDEIEFTMLSFYDPPRDEPKRWRNIKARLYGGAKSKTLQKIGCIFKTILTVLKEEPSFLICGHVNLAPLGLFQKRFFGLRYAVLTYGIDCWNIAGGIKYRGLKNADIVITMSEYDKKRMVENGIREDRIKVLHGTVDTSLFYRKGINQELINQLALENKRVLLTVGRITAKERYKGHDIMLEILREMDNDYVWLVIGEGDDLPRLRQKAHDLAISEKTRFLGAFPNEKLIDCYNLCDVFVMPSKGEGFGLVFLEAMACGKPVIAGNTDGSQEPLMGGKLGFLVNPDDAEEIKNTIKLALTCKEDRTDPEYLRREAEINFGKKVFNKRLKEIFSKKFQ